jgi:hypothetical protein
MERIWPSVIMLWRVRFQPNRSSLLSMIAMKNAFDVVSANCSSATAFSCIGSKP